MTLVARFVPPEPGRRTLLLLHGRGGDLDDLVPLARTLDPALGMLAPRGPEHQPPGYAWFRHERIGVPVIESLEARLAEVVLWLQAEARSREILAPMVALGFSNGGMMAGALAAARPDLVGAVGLLSSAYPLPADAYAGGGLAGAPIFAATGDDDPYHPMETFGAGLAAYREAGAQVTARVYPGMGHEIGGEEAADLGAWLSALPA